MQIMNLSLPRTIKRSRDLQSLENGDQCSEMKKSNQAHKTISTIQEDLTLKTKRSSLQLTKPRGESYFRQSI